MFRALTHTFLITLAFACPMGVWAAEAEQATGTATAPAEPADPDESKSGEQRSDPEGNTEVFIPTEEISEDFAVSFPVDI